MMTARAQRHAKRVEPQLLVLVDIRGERVRAGTLALQELGSEGFAATFQYLPEYLARAREGRAFPLDPINLPLDAAPVSTENRYSRLGALFDAAPDAWGRTVMANAEAVLPTALSETQVLLKGRGSGVGAILFTPVDVDPAAVPTLPALIAALPGMDRIDAMYGTVRAIESGAEVQEALRAMLSSSWDMGGARPKAVVRDAAGREWIVKFPRSIDRYYSRQRVEWANLEMARAIGMTVPEIRLHPLEDGDCALLVRRFDRQPLANGGEHRLHFMSAVSLLSPPADFDKREMDTPRGAAYFSYVAMTDIIRRISSNLVHDLQELYARMVFNVLVHNTDDHLKNTGFRMDPASPDFRYRLSPLYDIVTQDTRSPKHLLHVGPGIGNATPAANGRMGSIKNLLAGAADWGLKPAAAERILARVQDVVAQRQDFYREAGMPDDEIDAVDRWTHAEAATPQPSDDFPSVKPG